MIRIAVASFLLALPSVAPATTAEPHSMEFVRFIPCFGNASFCAPRLLARGEIDAQTPARLEHALEGFDFKPTIVFDSPGGSVVAGLRLGEIIRRHGLSTEVGPEYTEEVFLPGKQSTEIRPVARDPVCLSACAYAFMGGVSRTLVEGGRLGVHQFQGGVADQEAVAQSLVSVISQYMLSMGIDRDVLDVAGLTRADDITLISRSDAIAYNLDNQTPPKGRWELTALDGGYRAVKTSQQLPGSDRKTSVVLMADDANPDILHIMIAVGKIEDPADRASYLSARDPSLCSSSGCLDLTTELKWDYVRDPGIIRGMFRGRHSLLLALIAGQSEITLDAGMSNAVYDLSPSVTLSTVGLRNALLALD